MAKKRTFQFSDGSSNKFWQIELSGKSHTTTYGRVGSSGQSTTKSFPTAEKANASCEKLIDQKINKGYIETSGSTSKKPVKRSVGAKSAVKKAKGSQPKTEKLGKSGAADQKSQRSANNKTISPQTALKSARLFVFDDGKSNKFWAIQQQGATQIVNYGRTGTSGQTKSKKFADAQQAKASSEKLIAEKLLKGYIEIDENGRHIAKSLPPPKPSKPVDAEEAMFRIHQKEQDIDGLVCTESLDFRGEPLKNQSRRWGDPIKRKKTKALVLPTHLKAPGVNLSGSDWLTSVPPGWDVIDLVVADCPKLVELGANLKCYRLDASNSALETLPDDIQVEYKLDLSGCRKLKSLPEGLKVTSLILADCTSLTKLPEGLDVLFLDVRGCAALESLPKRGSIDTGALIANGCRSLRGIPTWLNALSRLSIEDCNQITKLPAGLAVSSWLDIAGSGLKSLPASAKKAPLRWRGVPIDYHIAFEPRKIKGTEVLAEENVERRRVMLQQMGFERFLKQVDAEVLDVDQDAGGERRLLRVRMENDEDLVCVSVNCPSTGRQYIIRVPPRTRTCQQGIAWTAGFDDPKKYKPIRET